MTVARERDATASVASAMLERLVQQFASPYDFLRELVQNAIDAQSDSCEVALSMHRDRAGDRVVFEIAVTDAGSGMDEAIIDDQFTRMFASQKTRDLTMAGGFGVGFVSVFAWEPEVVLVQTGRRDEGWEIEFDAEAAYVKRRLVDPIEGTCVRLLRRGHASEYAGIALAVRRSLHRWCRFCPIAIDFCDLGDGHEASARRERIHERRPGGEPLEAVHESADTTIVVSFTSEPRAVLLRHGLVLAQGEPQHVLPALASQHAGSLDHLDVWASSPSLSTDIGRDRVLHDAGRRLIEQRIGDMIGQLGERALAEIRQLVESAAPWDEERQRQYTFLHAHVACERSIPARVLDTHPLFRTRDGATNLLALRKAARWGVVSRTSPEAAELDVLTGVVPELWASDDDEEPWLAPLLASRKLHCASRERLVREVSPAAGELDPGVARACALLVDAGVAASVRRGHLGGDGRLPLGVGLPGATTHAVVPVVPLSIREPVPLWLDDRHPLYAIGACMPDDDITVGPAALALAITTILRGDLEAVRRAIDDELARQRVPRRR